MAWDIEDYMTEINMIDEAVNLIGAERMGDDEFQMHVKALNYLKSKLRTCVSNISERWCAEACKEMNKNE